MMIKNLICVIVICEFLLFTNACNDGCIIKDTSCEGLVYICKQFIYSDVCNAACNNEAVPNNDLSCKYKGTGTNFIDYFNRFNGSNDPVICPKMIVPPPSPVDLTIDSTNVKVSCSTKGTNKPVQYFKNGVELQKEVNNGQLLFPTVYESIKGIYTCVVTNDEKRRSSHMFEIRVNTPPALNLTMIPKSPQKDDNVTFYCNVTAGTPLPSFIWKFNGKEVSNEKFKNYQNYSVLRILGFQSINSGIYKCIGKNVAGITTEQIEYTISDTKQTSTFNTVIIVIVVLVLCILVGFIGYCIWKHKKKNEDKETTPEKEQHYDDRQHDVETIAFVASPPAIELPIAVRIRIDAEPLLTNNGNNNNNDQSPERRNNDHVTIIPTTERSMTPTNENVSHEVENDQPSTSSQEAGARNTAGPVKVLHAKETGNGSENDTKV